MKPTLLLFAIMVVFTGNCYGSEEQAARRQLVAEIAEEVRATRLALDRQPLDEAVLAALAAVPRHQFVPRDQRRFAYENRPLPIGHGQTISQPFIVALMTDLLELEPGQKVLEVGTGSGYQAAILAALGAEVHTLEIIEPLARQAAERFASLGLTAIDARFADGYYGLAEEAPFAAIIVTAAASHVPPPLVSQLAVGGRMVIPVGTPFRTQQLRLIKKVSEREVQTQQVLPVIFVPLTGNR